MPADPKKPPTTTYGAFIRKAKNLANEGEECRLRLMRFLVEMEPFTIVWRRDNRDTWAGLLKEEQICTPAKYYAFRDAQIIRDIPIDLMGVDAATLIAKLDPEIRNRVIRNTRKWIAKHDTRPTYQRITQYVRSITPKALRKPSKVAELRAYVKTLQALLKKNHIPYPVGP